MYFYNGDESYNFSCTKCFPHIIELSNNHKVGNFKRYSLKKKLRKRSINYPKLYYCIFVLFYCMFA